MEEEPFPILQGIGQDGIIAPVMYIVYINELLRELALNKLGLYVGDISCPSPCYADDITLLATFPSLLSKMMNIAYKL